MKPTASPAQETTGFVDLILRNAIKVSDVELVPFAGESKNPSPIEINDKITIFQVNLTHCPTLEIAPPEQYSTKIRNNNFVGLFHSSFRNTKLE